jgi:oligopeptide/dipeptide ABC transporter ATP-binding protein
VSDPLLEVDDLTVQYRTKRGMVTAVSDVSFTIERGQYFGLVGESGCGKSTLAKAILGGLDSNGRIVSGAIRYKGTPIHDMSDAELRDEVRGDEISWIPQGSMNSLDPLMRVSEQAVKIAQAHTGLSPIEAKEKFREMFEIVGLQTSRIDDYPHQFSGGMQQRAIIALGLFLDPSLVIADEPTTALDVITQDQVFKYLDRIQEQTDTSMMLITHDISVVFESCQKVVVMHGGQVAESGSAVDVFDMPRHPYTILLQRAFPDVRYPDQDLAVIDGTPPDTYGEIDFCTFADRCPLAVEECRQSTPPTESVVADATTADSIDHEVACFRSADAEQLYENPAETPPQE